MVLTPYHFDISTCKEYLQHYYYDVAFFLSVPSWSVDYSIPVIIEWYVTGGMVEITVLVNISKKPSHSLITYYVMEFRLRMLIKN